MEPLQPPRNALVVIGIGGMGLAAVRRLAGGRRLLLADYSGKALENAIASLREDGHDVDGHVVDISDYSSVEKLAAAAAAAGRIDAIVHTAGISPVMASAKAIHEVDLVGTANVIDAFFPVVSPGTSLVCVASMAPQLMGSLSPGLEEHLATAPRDQLLEHKELDLDVPAVAYSQAKRGNQLRVQAAARAWGSKGARLNTVSPGLIVTSMGRKELEGPTGDIAKSLIGVSAARRGGTADEIARVVAFLAGPDASYITGTDVLADGGTVAGRRWGNGAAA